MTWPIAVSPLGPVEIGTVLWRRKGRMRLTAVVKATFAMIHGGFCLPIDPKRISMTEESWLDVEGSSPELVVETWPELMRPEVLLWGNAVTPEREPMPALATRLVIWKGHARLDKTVHVMGTRGGPEFMPAPFSTLPLVWERASKGSSGTNPVGVKEGRMPNLLHPRKPAEPACYAPRGLGWPGREPGAMVGFPGREVWDWPDAVSVEVFSSAPEDQRLPSLDGDEWILLDGMHAELPRFATRLPMPVATANLRDEASRREPIPLALDTLAIDATNLQVSLLWRGSIALIREHWSDLVVEADLDLGEPSRLDQMPPATNTRAVGLGRGLRLKSDPPSAPVRPIISSTPLRGEHPAQPLSGVSAKREGGFQAPFENPAPLPLPGLVPPPNSRPRPPPPPADLDGPLAATGRLRTIPPAPAIFADAPSTFAEESSPLTIASPGTRVTPGMEFARTDAAMSTSAAHNAMAAPPPAPIPAPAAVVAQAPAPAPASRPEAERGFETTGSQNLAPLDFAGLIDLRSNLEGESGLRGIVVSRLANKEPLADLNLTNADLSQLDLSDALLTGLNMSGARLVGSLLRNARLSNTKLAGADLSQADLSGADLTQADLSRAILVETSFQRAQLLDANLAGGEGKRARFDGARAQRAIFAQGKWSESVFIDADLSGADVSGSELSKTRFDNAILTGARFVDARANQMTTIGAKLSDANLAGASFVDCDFSKIEAPRTVWDRAVVDGSTFDDAKLDAAGFARAHLDRTSFARATLVKASLMGVTGESASFIEANLESVDLRQGKLMDSKFDRARLCKINALKATFSGATMGGADLTGASLRSAKMRSAVLAGAILRDADLRDADLEQADLRGADRQGAKLAGASLKGASEGE